jgi:hypothetical protein
MEQIRFVELKDVAVDTRSIVAFGKLTIPATLQTPEAFALTVWLADVPEPITATYVDLKERDEQYALLKKATFTLTDI